ncbi:MAG: galactokinase [Bacteroidales bacterium]
MDNGTLRDTFANLYGDPAEEPALFFAPGRVNLIGEHTDYNQGYVLPCALSFGTYLLVRRNRSGNCHFSSENERKSFTIPLHALTEKKGRHWVNYPLGVMQQLVLKGMELEEGFDFYYSGDIPGGAGLSSSASVEMVTAVALNELCSLDIDRVELIKLCQKAENDFVGVNCGIMDQFIVGKARENHALFLNCGTLQYRHVPFVIRGYQLLIANTNKKRSLDGSIYNQRVAECRSALDYFRASRMLGSLTELSVETFEKENSRIKDPVILKRARHVVTENRRVLESVKALMNNEYEDVGRLMVESHRSLKNDYEVTGKELDALVEAALDVEGTLGARMTGAGLGGCTVNLVKSDQVERFMEQAGSAYHSLTGLKADFYVPGIAGAAGRIG